MLPVTDCQIILTEIILISEMTGVEQMHFPEAEGSVWRVRLVNMIFVIIGVTSTDRMCMFSLTLPPPALKY